MCLSAAVAPTLALHLSLPLSLSLYFLPPISLKSQTIPPPQDAESLVLSLITFHISTKRLDLNTSGHGVGRLPGKIKPIGLQTKARIRHKNLRTNLRPLLHCFIRQGSSDDISAVKSFRVLRTKISPQRLSALTRY